MVATLTTIEQEPLVLDFSSVLQKLTEDEFYEFCRLNDELRIELTSEGELLIMPPTGGKTGIRNFKLIASVGGWVIRDGTGQGFDSSTFFTLPNGAKRSPDFAWVRNERWQALTEKEQERFSPICPDFVIELRSPTDSLKRLRRKMEEYIANGAQLGWLLDPFERKVYVYRPQVPVEVLADPQTVSGEPLLRGLTLNLQEIWD
jgi:Uma2 family endonuclease